MQQVTELRAREDGDRKIPSSIAHSSAKPSSTARTMVPSPCFSPRILSWAAWVGRGSPGCARWSMPSTFRTSVRSVRGLHNDQVVLCPCGVHVGLAHRQRLGQVGRHRSARATGHRRATLCPRENPHRNPPRHAERVAKALNTDGAKLWADAVDRLFGSRPALRTRRRRLRLRRRCPHRTGALPGRCATALRDDRLRNVVTFVKPGVAVDSAFRAGEAEHAAFEEMARAGSRLEAGGSLHADEASAALAEALLVAGAAMVERIGGKRRRGTGRCHITVEGLMSLRDAVTLIEATSEPATIRAEGSRQDAIAVARGSQLVEFPIEIKALTTLVCPAQVVGNVTESLEYVPGSNVLAMVAGAVQRAGLDVSNLIATGGLRVMPALPDVAGATGFRPPFALHRKKAASDNDPATNALHPEGRKDLAESEVPLRAMRGGWLSGSWGLTRETPLSFHTHGSVDDESQRPKADAGGGVYTYSGISAGTVLRSSLIVEVDQQDRLAAELAKVAGEHRLGRSKKDDYGLAGVRVGQPQTIALEQAPEGEATLWCLTDVVLLDEALRPSTSPNDLAGALARSIGAEVTVVHDRGRRGRTCARPESTRGRAVGSGLGHRW